MSQVYSRFPDGLANAVAAVIRALLDTDGSAILIHCTAGKDRTGFVAALLLHAWGIRRDAVTADYLLSNASYADAGTRFNVESRRDAIQGWAQGSVAARARHHPDNTTAP